MKGLVETRARFGLIAHYVCLYISFKRCKRRKAITPGLLNLRLSTYAVEHLIF
jgi:hypothetical protein